MEQNIIIYNTPDGKASVSLYARNGSVWMNQNQFAELFATSVPNISMYISNILQERELMPDSVIKDYLTTATDGKLKNIFTKNNKKYFLFHCLYPYIAFNNTCHASQLNSAPGQVFAFIGLNHTLKLQPYEL